MRAERRRMMMADKMLPAEYQKLKYIASANGAYIDSGLFGSDALDFEMVAYSDLTSIQAFFGNRTKEAQRSYLLLYDRGNNFYQFDVDTLCNYFARANNVVASKKGNVLTLNGVSATRQINAFTTPQHLYILGLNDNGRIKFNVKGARIYSLKFSQNGTLVRHFIPSKRKIDGTIGMYDLVGKQFYTSPNGVAFTGG